MRDIVKHGCQFYISLKIGHNQLLPKIQNDSNRMSLPYHMIVQHGFHDDYIHCQTIHCLKMDGSSQERMTTSSMHIYYKCQSLSNIQCRETTALKASSGNFL